MTLTLREVKKGLFDLLKTKYPDYHYYSMAVTEGYKRPSFFTQIKPVSMNVVTERMRENVIAFYIDYFQEHVDEMDMLDKIDEIKKLFGTHVKINDRALDVTSFEYDFIGTDRNILEISIELEWMEKIEQINTQPVMESAFFNTEMEE